MDVFPVFLLEEVGQQGEQRQEQQHPDAVVVPYITWQQVGGTPVNFLDTATLPSKANGRFQINTWAATRAEALTLAKQVENAVRATTSLQPAVLSQPVATTDEETGRKGYRQDFSLWN